MVIPSYTQWRDELTAPLPPERRGDRLTEAHLMSGFWRIESAKTKPDYGVAIWTEQGRSETIFQIGHRIRNTAEHDTEWQEFATGTFLKCIAVSKADWSAALETGFWPDGKPARQMSVEEKAGLPAAPPEGEPSNAPPVEESLADQIKNLAEVLEATAEPMAQVEADALAGKLDRMRLLLKLAEGEREKEKAPFLQGGREVDARWQAIGGPGGEAYRAGETRKKAFLKKEEARVAAAAAAERKRQQQLIDAENEKIRIDNERIRKEHEARQAEALAAARAVKPGEIIESSEVEVEEIQLVPELAPAVVETPKVSAGSAFGRSTGLTTKKVGNVTDTRKLVEFFLTTEDADFGVYLADRAQKAARAKIALPGVTITEERV